MKKLLALLLFTPALAMASGDFDQPIKQALAFNKWYLQQIKDYKNPLTDGHDIDKFVTASTLKKLRAAVGNDNEYYDADFFTRSQVFDDNWPENVSVVSSDYDPVCLNIYVSFGKDEKHTVIDCMVKEGGTWKIQSVAGQAILKNENAN